MIESLGLIEYVDADTLAAPKCRHFMFRHDATYRMNGETEVVHVLVMQAENNVLAVLTTSDVRDRLDSWQAESADELSAIATALGTRPLNLSAPLPLDTVHIPKPWGQEIWYSGIEARGVCSVHGVSIAWLVDIFGPLLGTNGAPMLLKILDPRPEPELGDLYFEMHEQKIEVYVVTNVDREAWPDGVGLIRYGFNQARRQEYESTQAFLRGYVSAVKAYQAVRNAIDAGDIGREAEERQLREAMNAFTATVPLSAGDVVTVQPLVPHSLQHGVRVIEFQTPHYERYILSFGQKVLTQDHWDTEEAVTKAVTGAVSFDEPVRIDDQRDLIADFSAFRVERITLGENSHLQMAPRGYTMVIGVTGEASICLDGNEALVKAEAAFLNPKCGVLEFRNTGRQAATLLVAEETG